MQIVFQLVVSLPWGLRSISQRCLLLLWGGWLSFVVLHAEGYFSASNLGGSAVQSSDGFPLSRAVGRVELLDGTNLLASGVLLRDGLFALGTVYDPLPGEHRILTFRCWTAEAGARFDDALAAGGGFVQVKLPVTLARDITPPRSLGAMGFPETKLSTYHSPVAWAFDPRSFPTNLLTVEDPGSGISRSLRAQLFKFNSYGVARLLSKQISGPFPPEAQTVSPNWYDVIIEDSPWKFRLEWRASVLVRLWDPATGDTYANAGLRGVAFATLTGPNPEEASIAAAPIQLARMDTPSVGMFQSPEGRIHVLNPDGSPAPKETCQVEIRAGSQLLKSFSLPEEGGFPLPSLNVPGTLPYDGAVITIRAWIPGPGTSFESAAIQGAIEQGVTLGGDNVPPGTLASNVLQMARAPSAEPVIVRKPLHDLIARAGTRTSLSVGVNGEDLDYQWQFSTTGAVWSNLSEGSLFSGTRSATLELPSVTTEHAGLYRVVARNLAGSITNNATTLHVRDAAAIRFESQPNFRFGSPTRLRPIAPLASPIRVSIVSGPAIATALSDGGIQVDPLGTGTLVLRATQESPSSYVILDSEFAFPITKGRQSIQWQGLPSEVEVESALGLVATASSGLPVTFSIRSGPGRLIEGRRLVLDHPGTLVLVATQPGDANYESVVVQRSLRIVEGPQAVQLIRSGATWTLLFRGEAGRLHIVESSTTPDGMWQELLRLSGTGMDRDTSAQLSNTSDSVRFFRVRLK